MSATIKNKEVDGLDIAYFTQLFVAPGTSVANLSVPDEILEKGKREAANNLSIYIGDHKDKDKLLMVCLHAFLLRYLGEKQGLRYVDDYWDTFKSKNGLDPNDEIQNFDFCLGSCFKAGSEAADPDFYEKQQQCEAETNKLYERACSLVAQFQKTSIPLLQRNLGIGYSRAAQIMELLIENNMVREEKPDPEALQQKEDALVERNYDKARQLVIQSQQASVSFLQRRLSLGYTVSKRIMDLLEDNKIVGPANGFFGPREVLVKDIIPNIYLDIDGVLLANENYAALHAKEFLARVLEKYPDTTYWLTTHCQGDSETPIQHVGHLFDNETVALMRRIKPTKWTTAKTEAIDFTKPFLWFDDDCFPDERIVLTERGVFDNWIEVDLSKNINQLRNFIESFPIPIKLK